MSIRDSKLKILKKLSIESLPGVINKYNYRSKFIFLSDFTIKSFYLRFFKYNTLLLYKKKNLKYLYNLKSKVLNFIIKIYKNQLNLVIHNLSNRLYTILVTLGISSTIYESKQYIKHGKVFINGIKVSSNNILINKGDFIKIISINNNFNKLLLYFNLYNNNLKFSHISKVVDINNNNIYVYKAYNIRELYSEIIYDKYLR